MKTVLSLRECSPAEYAAALPQLSQKGEPLPMYQAPFYGAWQERDGKTVVYFTAHENGGLVAAGLAVKYDAPGGISFLYCPYGPVARQWTPELYAALREFLVPIAKRTSVAFVRLDSVGLAGLQGVQPIANHLAVTASLQPRAEWLLDISRPQDDIWMGMHKHARYNVRLNERAHAELKFYEPAKAPLDTFFALMRATADRDSFTTHSRAYYEAVLQSVPAQDGFLVICSIDGKPAATALFATYDGLMHYTFAGSSNDFRKIAPPYFVMWQAILEAKKRGWQRLSFGGVMDDVKGTHLAGVTGFKKRFGGYQIDHPNPVDIVYKPFKYRLFDLYKRFR